MAQYNIDEILQIAIQIEVNGEILYHYLSGRFKKNKDLVLLFNYLEAEETKHKSYFQDYLNTFHQYEPAENYPQEYFSYLKAFAEKLIFSKEKFTADIEAIDSIPAALDFAMKRELESITYYNEIKPLIDQEQHAKIDKIIAAERKHYLNLYQMLERVNKT